MSQQGFEMDCLYCDAKLACPVGSIGKRVRCHKCGSAMMIDPARKSDASFQLPDTVPEPKYEERDDTDI